MPEQRDYDLGRFEARLDNFEKTLDEVRVDIKDVAKKVSEIDKKETENAAFLRGGWWVVTLVATSLLTIGGLIGGLLDKILFK